MNKLSISRCFKWIGLLATLCPVVALADTSTATTTIQTDQVVAETSPQPYKPSQIKVYWNENVGLSRKPFAGGKEKVLPTNDEFQEKQGCYLSCYSKSAKNGVIHMGENVYLMGQIRVAGTYTNGFCTPKGYESKDIRSSKEFKEKCTQSFPDQCEKGKCWAESNRSGFFD